MNVSGEAKLFFGVIVVSLLTVVFGVYVVSRPTPIYGRVQLIPENSVTLGPADASVYLVEFSDFQCPACKAFAPIVDQIMQKYENKIYFSYRHFPLPQHQNAEYAARVFEAANEQGKAWEMSKYLFDNQTNLTETVINGGITKLGLNKKQFTIAVNSKKNKTKVDQDLADAIILGVNATPTFFLNGKKLHLSSPQDLVSAVDDAVNDK